MADDSDLLPCPHCGAPAKSHHRPDDSGWSNTDWICCDAGDDGIGPECGAQTCLHESRAQAVAAWNKRPALGRHYLTRDNDAHWYVVPVERSEEWEDWLALDSDDQRSWETPAWAKRVDSPSTLSFAEWTEDV